MRFPSIRLVSVGLAVSLLMAGSMGGTAFSQATPSPTPSPVATDTTTTPVPGTTAAPTTTTAPAASLSLSSQQGAANASITVTASGFRPGEGVQVTFNGAAAGQATADTTGSASVKFNVPNLAPGPYNVVAAGQSSGVALTATFTITASNPSPTAVPAATPAPVSAPPLVHDDRYFSQTGYRVDNDQVWSFFQSYGGIAAFGYPTSRTVTFLGCPVQFFQRQIIQVCASQGPALINMLDPEIFPYTKVNGSTFPGPDDAMKASTPPVSDPNYAENITRFIQENVPDTAGGQPVNFQQTFNARGGLTIWGAPISRPAPDPSNGNFIYQRFQRGIMHFIGGTGTESILLADYLKAILMNQNVPQDLLAQSRESRYSNQYCPGSPLWLCRPNDLPGTDLTFGFVTG